MTQSVLHVIPAVAPRYGGPSIATAGMCRALEAAGVSTLVATTDADGPVRLPVVLGRTQDWRGMQVIFFRRRFGEAYKWSAGLGPWLARHVSEFDLVHVHAVFSHASLAAGRACRHSGVPYVVRPLGTLDPWSLNRHAVRKKLLFSLGVRRLLTGAAAVHYTSDEERRLAERQMRWLPRAAVVPLGVNDELFGAAASHREERPPYVLTLSRLDEKKGIDVLIEAVHKIAEDATQGEWRLVIAGDGDAAYVERLRHLADSGPASRRIDFRGWVDGAERTALFQGASVFALPSNQENFGVAMVEAMASGVPVVVSPGVNLGEEIAAAGAGWVVPRHADAWRAALVSVMADDEERRRRGCRARRFAERFRWPAVADGLLSMYEDARVSAEQRRPSR